MLSVNTAYLIAMLILRLNMTKWLLIQISSKPKLEHVIWKLKFQNYNKNLVTLTWSILIQLIVPIQLTVKLSCQIFVQKCFRFKPLAWLTTLKNLSKWELIFHVIWAQQMWLIWWLHLILDVLSKLWHAPWPLFRTPHLLKLCQQSSMATNKRIPLDLVLWGFILS